MHATMVTVDFDLPNSRSSSGSRARFATKRDRSYAAQWDRDEVFPVETVLKMGGARALRAAVPTSTAEQPPASSPIASPSRRSRALTPQCDHDRSRRARRGAVPFAGTEPEQEYLVPMLAGDRARRLRSPRHPRVGCEGDQQRVPPSTAMSG